MTVFAAGCPLGNVQRPSNVFGFGSGGLKAANAAAGHNELQGLVFGGIGIFRKCGNVCKVDGLLGTGGTAVHTKQAASVMVCHGAVLGHGDVMGGASLGAQTALYAQVGIECNFGSHNITSFYMYYTEAAGNNQ